MPDLRLWILIAIFFVCWCLYLWEHRRQLKEAYRDGFYQGMKEGRDSVLEDEPWHKLGYRTAEDAITATLTRTPHLEGEGAFVLMAKEKRS
jgi:hypothetical protein